MEPKVLWPYLELEEEEVVLEVLVIMPYGLLTEPAMTATGAPEEEVEVVREQLGVTEEMEEEGAAGEPFLSRHMR